MRAAIQENLSTRRQFYAQELKKTWKTMWSNLLASGKRLLHSQATSLLPLFQQYSTLKDLQPANDQPTSFKTTTHLEKFKHRHQTCTILQLGGGRQMPKLIATNATAIYTWNRKEKLRMCIYLDLGTDRSASSSPTKLCQPRDKYHTPRKLEIEKPKSTHEKLATRTLSLRTQNMNNWWNR